MLVNIFFCIIRFGEESLHSCEVMLKDIEDSKRTNNGVHSEVSRGLPPPPATQVLLNFGLEYVYVCSCVDFSPFILLIIG